MGIYSQKNNNMIIDEEFGSTEEELVTATVEAAIFDDLAMMTLEQRQMFINSEEFKVLSEAGLTGAIGRNTIVKLNKADDMERRIGQAGLTIAREKNDALWIALMKNRKKERKLLNAIDKKYRNQAERVAKVAQKQYLKTHKLAVGFMRK